MSIAEIIEQKKLQIKDKQNTIAEIYADTSLIPPQQERLSSRDPRCPKECGRFNGGNLSCRNRCDRNYYQGYDRNQELRNQAVKTHITPISNQIKNLEKEIVVLEEKSSIPLLRQQLLTATSEFEELSRNDPEFRQKQIDQKKSLYERAVALDSLERKHNLFGNLPPVRMEPQITVITPEPIVKHSIQYQLEEIDKKPIVIGAVIGIAALILLWRFK